MEGVGGRFEEAIADAHTKCLSAPLEVLILGVRWKI